MQIIDFVLHCDIYIEQFISSYGNFVYLIIFAVIFSETGLVFLPFLPGDSLIFATGALAGTGKLNVWVMLIVLIAAAVLGNTVNYEVGKRFGRRILDSKKFKLIKDEDLHKANQFVKKHGGKAVLLARFFPIFRTIVPFVVGMGKLDYFRFFRANVIGCVLWVFSFFGLGYFFGNLEVVKNNFSAIIIGIIVVSVMPIAFSYLKSKFFDGKNK